jgi:predicted acylesterase/phospholipase RssA|uniref:PNPLA domain-containing protein n=1 Tax=viral metagenome TaxID=1070528 RepID=A0A6C0CVN0_9ZZZZ
MTIKHIVISGGGPTGLKSLGALQYLEKSDFWKIENIESIYATSAGAMIGLLIVMKIKWNYINDYVVKRPWHEVFDISINQIFEAFSKKGLFDEKVIDIFFTPFFNAIDLSINTTMRELYEYSKIDFHVFSLEMNQFEMIDVSHNSHPNLKVFDAIHMTTALPLVITPRCVGDKCYVDGGVVSNYPLNYCIQNNKISDENLREILGVRNNYENDENAKTNIVNNESTILDYITIFINKLVMNVDTEPKQIKIPNEVVYKTQNLNFAFLKSTISSSEEREKLLKDGIEAAESFLSLTQNKNDKVDEK